MNVEVIDSNQDEEVATKTLILDKAVSLFSQRGFNGVSMRELSTAASITPAALYYYFPNKKVLHEAAIYYAYRERDKPAVHDLQETELKPIEILERFVFRLCERFYHDPEFRRLVQWSLLDSETDENIGNIIINVVYEKHFDSLTKFLKEFDSGLDPNRLSVFIFGMVMQNYFTLPIRSKRKDYMENKEKPEQLTRDVMAVLTSGIFKKH